MNTTNDTLRQTSERFADALSTWTTTWMNAWRNGTDAMLRGFVAPACSPNDPAGNGAAASAADAGVFAPAFGEAVTPLREQASSIFRNMVDLGAAGTKELAALGGEQARFMARVSERGFDCVFGPQPARSSEALLATAQAMGSDLMENAATVGEKLFRLNARTIERSTEILGTQIDRAASATCCGGGACDSDKSL